MATYLPGLTEFIPQIRPFSPDLNFYANALQTKQSQYDAAHKELSSVYGSLLSSPMLRESNINRRDEFFKVIDTDLKKIAGMDLSLPENINTAMNLFRPFYEDQNMVKDMIWTKNYQKELQRGENFRSCVDPNKCGGQYWEGGIRALNYKADEFRKVSDQEALSFGNTRFTPFVNVTEKAMKAAKEAGFNVKVDQLKGGYIVTTKNGQLLEAPLQSFFTSLFGSDQAVMDMFKTQAYLNRKDFVASNQYNFGSETAAEEAYVQSFMNQAVPTQQTEHKEVSDTHDSLLTRKQALDIKISQEGVLLNSQDHREYLDLQSQLEAAGATKEFYDQGSYLLKSTSNNTDISAMRDSIDGMVALSLFSGEMKNAAQTFAYRDYEKTMRPDAFALASHSSKLSLNNSLTLKQADYEYWMKKEDYKQNVEDIKRRGGSEFNLMDPLFNIIGTATPEQEQEQALSVNQAFRNRLTGERADSKQRFLMEMATSMADAYSTASASEQKLILSSLDTILKGTGLDSRQVVSGDMIALLNNIPRSSRSNRVDVNTIYERALSVSDPNNSTWAVNKFWSESFWNQTTDMRSDVTNADKVLSTFNSFYKMNADNAITEMRKSQYYGGDAKDLGMLTYLTDRHGKLMDKEEFARRAADNMHQDFRPGKKVLGDIYIDVKEGEIPVSENPAHRAARTEGYRTSREAAYQYALDHYDEYKENYQAAYKVAGRPFNGTAALGNAGGGAATAAHGGKVDPYMYSSDNYLRVNSFLKNYQNVSGAEGVQVRFSDDKGVPIPDVVEELSEKASSIVNQLISDQSKSYKETDKGRPTYRFMYQNIVDNDQNKTALTIYPDQQWLDKYKGSKASPGLTWGMDVSKGLTIVLPADQANNEMRQFSDFDGYDFMLEQMGKMDITEYSDKAGAVSIVNKGGSYYATGNIKEYDPQTGQLISRPLNMPIGGAFDASSAYRQIQSMLSDQYQANLQAEAVLKQLYGVKDPAKLNPQ